MPFTVQSYSSFPSNIDNWVKQESSEKPGYVKFIETQTKNSISKCKSADRKILLLEIITLGIYYFFKSKTDTNNIKSKTLVYYVKANTSPKTSLKTDQQARQALSIPSTEVTQTKNQSSTSSQLPALKNEALPPMLAALTQEKLNQKAAEKAAAEKTKQNSEKPKTLKEQIHTLISEATALRQIKSDLDSILKTKKDSLFLHLADENAEMADALAKFYASGKSGDDDQQTSFLKALQPFFARADVKTALQNAISNTKNRERPLSAIEKKFRGFRKKYHALEDRCNWLLVLRSNGRLYEVATTLIKQFDNFYEGVKAFEELYKNHSALIEECIKTLDNIELKSDDKKVKEGALKTFTRGKQLSEAIEKKIDNTNYSPLDYFKNEFSTCPTLSFHDNQCELGLNDNKMGVTFLKMFFKHGEKNLSNTFKTVEDQLALYKSDMKVIAHDWQESDKVKEAQKNKMLKSSQVVKAFNEIKAFYDKNKDTISILTEVSLLVGSLNLNEVEIPFPYIKEFSRIYSFAGNTPNISFYDSFAKYFQTYQEHHAAIMKIIEMAKD